ncbi:MAG: hypothetical protein ACYC5V_01640 [Gemmatimonadaceae bacterium]
MRSRTVLLLFAPLIARALDAQELTGVKPRPLGGRIVYPELTAITDVVVASAAERRTMSARAPCWPVGGSTARESVLTGD